MARLNDTKALVERAPSAGSSHHISTQKIDNGYLVRKSVCTDAGEYKSEESFSRNAPRVEVRVNGRAASVGCCGNEDAQDAATYLGKK